MAVSIDTTFDMRASSCIIFLVLLIAVRAFPQHAIEFATEAPTIVEENNVVNGNEPSDEKESNATTIDQNSGIIANEAVLPGAAVGGVTSEVVIPTANEGQASEASIPDVSEATNASEAVTTVEANGGVASEAVIPVEARSASEAVIPLVASEAVIPVEARSASEAVIPLVASEAEIPVEARSADEAVIPLVPEVANEVAVEARSANEAVISVSPEATNEEVASVIPVQSTAANDGVANEVVTPEVVLSQNTDVNEILVPSAPKLEITTIEDAIVDILEAVVNEVVVGPSEEVQSKAIPVPSEVANVVPVPDQSEVFSLRSIVPSPTTAAPANSQEQQSVPEAVINSESPPPTPATTEAPVSSVSTPVPETTSVASATEATEGQVANISAIIFGEESAVKSDLESTASTNEIRGRSSLTDFPEIEVIIPLVDFSVPAISGRSLNFDPVSDTVPDSDISSSSSLAPSAAQVPDAESVVAAVAEPEMPSNAVPVESVEDVGSAAPVSALDATIPTAASGSGSNSTCSDVSSTTEGSVPTVNVSEAESIAPTNDATVEVTSTNNEEASETDVSARSESPTSTAGIEVANAETGVPTESVSSTTAGPDSTDLIPEAKATTPADAPISSDPVVATSDSVSSTTSAPEVPSGGSNSQPIVPSESEVTSSTDASVVVDSTPAPSTASAVSSSTSSIPCTKAGNFSVPTNCRLYRTCSTVGTDLSLQERECPEGHAYSSVIQRCSRDISPCGDAEPVCTRSGSIADPNTSSAYYWCAASLLGGYHKYHVQCDSNEVYVSSISRCLPEALHISQKGASDARSDRDIVKAEWKILKKEIKLQAKEDKVRQKMEAKAKAYAEKLATKSVKKQKGDTKKHDDSDEEDDDDDED